MKWTGPYTIVEVTAVRDINPRTKINIFQNSISPKTFQVV